MRDRETRFNDWSGSMVAAASQNLAGLEPDGDLEPALLMGTEDADGKPGEMIIAPLRGVLGTPEWPDFRDRVMPAVIVERQAALVAVVTMGWQRDYPDGEKAEVAIVVTGGLDVGVQTHVAQIERSDDAPPRIVGDWEVADDGGAVVAAVRLGLAAQGG